MEVDSGDSGWKRVVAVVRRRTLLNGQRIRVLCLGLNLPHGIVEQKGKFCIGKRNYRWYTKYAQHPKYTKKASGTSGEYYFPALFSVNFLIGVTGITMMLASLHRSYGKEYLLSGICIDLVVPVQCARPSTDSPTHVNETPTEQSESSPRECRASFLSQH